MSEQIAGGTPDSNTGGSKDRPSTTKDRACPFCHQQFTSSSLGRHLDLYIKEKNPKPADGVHNVDEIRKMRGHITRRQPRNSMSKRESSTPAGTPATSGRSPSLATAFVRKPSPGPRDMAKTPDTLNFPPGGVTTKFNHPNWEATGVINDIPPIPRNGYHQGSWDVEEEMNRRHADGKKSVGKQMLAKSAFDQKQKFLEAQDNARAAELALREVLGSIRAANERIKPNFNSPFDYDPLTLDFPGLCLQCLPPPPTLYSTTPVPSPDSWSIEPPDQTQFHCLLAHFQKEFRQWRVSTMIVDRHDSQDSLGRNEYMGHHNQVQSHAQEEAVTNHVNVAFSHWNGLSPGSRVAHWRLELARSVGRKAAAVQNLKEAQTYLTQENAHLRSQVDQLSRLQSPREFRISPPQTYNIKPEIIGQLNEIGLAGQGIGYELTEKKEDLSLVISKAISRWKEVVQSGRGINGQKKLQDGAPDPMSLAAHTTHHGLPAMLSKEDEDGEGERDDMEVDDHYIGMANGIANRTVGRGAPDQASMPMGMQGEASSSSGTRYAGNGGGVNNGRPSNGNPMGISDFER